MLCFKLHNRFVCRSSCVFFLQVVVIGALGGSFSNGRLTIGGLFGNLNLESLLSSDVMESTAGQVSPHDVVLNAYSDLECRYGNASVSLLQQLEDISAAGDTVQCSQSVIADLVANYHQCCALKVQMNRLRHILLFNKRHQVHLPSPTVSTSEGQFANLGSVLKSAPACVLQPLAGHLVGCLLSLCAQVQQQQVSVAALCAYCIPFLL